MPRFTSVVLLIIASLVAVTSRAASRPDYVTHHDPIGAIEADYRAGNLSYSQKALLQVRAIKRPHLLPDKYKIFHPQTGRSSARSATLALRSIVQNWNLLDSPTQSQISQLLTRWATQFTYNSPGGFFKLHYDTSGTNKVPGLDGSGNGIPDFVDKCAAYMDTTYAVHVALGYLLPPSDGTLGGDALYDVYFEETIYYGYAQSEGPGPQPWNDYYSYLVLNNNFLGFAPNDDPEGNVAGAAKATAAHEFHHAVQFAYDGDEASWFMELDATCMEDLVFDQVNDNHNYLPTFMNDPQVSLMDASSHWYSSFIWGIYLAERFDTSLVRAAWEGARYKSIFNALSDSLLGWYGWTQDSAFAEFTVWNYFAGSRDDGEHYFEGASYSPDVAVDRLHTSYPVATQNAPSPPQGYGSCYVQFVPDGSSGMLRLTFDGDNAASWAAYVIKELPNGTSSLEKFSLVGPGWADTLDILDFKTYARVTLVGINITEFSGTARNFTYTARIQQPYAISSTIVSDSQIYSGSSRIVKLRVRNNAPVGDGIKVTYSDVAGWITPGTLTFFLAAGDSANVTTLATVPAGTPVGAFSQVTFVSESQNDPSVIDTKQKNELVVIQRGDVNFSGLVDLTDLSQLIAYLLGSGLPPQPTAESGDFNCVGIVDLTDLSAMIAYLIGTGPKSPCNPY